MNASERAIELAVLGIDARKQVPVPFKKMLSRGKGDVLPYNGTPSNPSIIASLTPVAVAATATSIAQNVTISGLVSGDIITGITAGGSQPTGVVLKGWRVVSYAAGTVELMFGNSSGASATPYSGNYTFAIARMTGGTLLPLITSSAASGATTITGTTMDIDPMDTRIRQMGTADYWPGYSNAYIGPTHVSKTVGGMNGKTGSVMRFDFVTDAPKLEMTINGTGFRFRLIIDGQIVTPASYPVPNNYKTYRLLFDLTQGGTVTVPTKPRVWRFETTNDRGVPMIGKLTMPITASIFRPSSPNPTRCIMFGDSFTEGYLLADQFTAFSSTLPQLMGWDDAWVSGVGGTGYLKCVSGTTLKWRDRIGDITNYAPDVVVVLGSINDAIGSFYTDVQVGAECALFWQQLTAALPNTLFFCVGSQLMQPSLATASTLNALITAQNTAMKNAVTNLPNVYFIDMIAEGWFTGSGTTAVTKSDGNADIYLQPDGTHPVQAGHDFMAYRLAAKMRSLIGSA